MNDSRQDTDLKALQEILLRDHEQGFRTLEKRVIDIEQRTRDVAEVLPTALRRSASAGLAQALSEPITSSLRRIARRERKMLAEVMFPVIMPAIRKAVLESLRAWLKTVNHVLDHSLSMRGLAWRWQSIRTGVPFSEIVLKHTLIYRVEQLFLIHRHSGLLVAHQYHPDITARDSDAVSAMLTAIQDFMRDSFEGTSEGELEAINVGTATLWVIHDHDVDLACVIRGVPPEELREKMRDLLEKVVDQNGHWLRQFEGDSKDNAAIEAQFEEAIDQMGAEAVPKSKNHTLWAVFAVALFCWIAWFLFVSIKDRRTRLSYVTAQLEREPGYLINDASYHGDRIRVSGLKDPMARDHKLVLGEEYDIEDSWDPYFSLDPELVLLRLRSWIEVPESVHLEVSGHQLIGTGTAEGGWIANAKQSAAAQQLGYQLVLDDVQPVVDLAALRRSLELPDRVVLDAKNDIWSFSGELSWDEWMALKSRLRDHRVEMSFEQLIISEYLEALTLARLLSGTWATHEALDSDLAPLDPTAWQMNFEKLQKLTTSSRLKLRIDVEPFNDGTGTLEMNREVRQRRAFEARQILASWGVDDQNMHILNNDPIVLNGIKDLSLRRVDLSVTMEPPQLLLER